MAAQTVAVLRHRILQKGMVIITLCVRREVQAITIV